MNSVFLKLKSVHKKIIASFFIAILIISVGVPALFSVPKQADAAGLGCASSLLSGVVSSVTGGIGSAIGVATEVPVAENASRMKEGCLDEIAWAIAKLAVQKITQSLVQWINSGFNGNPAFISNPIGFFQDLGEQVLGEVIQGSSLGFICSPFQLTIKAALIRNQLGAEQQGSCTLGQIGNNFDNFVANLAPQFSTSVGSSGGAGGGAWGPLTSLHDFYNVTAPGGNYYSAYEAAQATLDIQFQSSTFNFKSQLDWGKGFLSWPDCSKLEPFQAPGPNNQNCPIATPGSVIVDQLNHTLGAGVDTLVTADEINEIISALFSQLLGQVFGAAQGLLGTSSGNSSYGGGSYLDALNADSAGQFNSTRDLTTSGIDANISVLQNYLNVKNQSLALVNASIALQNQIKTACGVSSSQASTAQNVITTQLQPLATSIQADITTANTYMAGFNTFKTRYASLGPSDTNGFNQVLSDYTDFLGGFNLDSMTGLAQSQKSTLPQQLNPLNTNAQGTINQCAVTAAGGTASGTGTAGTGSGSGTGSGGNAGGAAHNQ